MINTNEDANNEIIKNENRQKCVSRIRLDPLARLRSLHSILIRNFHHKSADCVKQETQSMMRATCSHAVAGRSLNVRPSPVLNEFAVQTINGSRILTQINILFCKIEWKGCLHWMLFSVINTL